MLCLAGRFSAFKRSVKCNVRLSIEQGDEGVHSSNNRVFTLNAYCGMVWYELCVYARTCVGIWICNSNYSQCTCCDWLFLLF